MKLSHRLLPAGVRAALKQVERFVKRRVRLVGRMLASQGALLGAPQAKLAYAHQGEDLVLDRILRKRLGMGSPYKGFYMDVGAYHPTQNSLTHFLYKLGWRGICVDISETSCARFRRCRPGDVTVCSGVGSEEGTATAYVMPEAIAGSNTLDAQRGAELKSDRSAAERHLPVTTVDQLMRTHAPQRSTIDFLNIDVEGYELEVLKGIDFDRVRPACVAVEIHDQISGASHVLAALETPVARHLRDRGYYCVGSCVITYFFVDQAFVEGD